MGLTMNTVNKVAKGTLLYTQNKAVDSVALLVKGKVLVYNVGTKIVCGPGSFIGVSDLVAGTYGANAYVMEESQIFPVEVHNLEEMEDILESHADYRSTIVMALSRQIMDLYKVFDAMYKCAGATRNFLETSYGTYKEIGKKNSVTVTKMESIEKMKELELPVSYEDMAEQTKYYLECVTLAPEVQKRYYAHGKNIAVHHMEEQVSIVSNLLEGCEVLTSYVSELVKIMVGEQDSLFSLSVQQFLAMKKMKVDTAVSVKLINTVKERIAEVESILLGKTGKKPDIDKEKMQQIYAMVDSGEVEAEEEDEVSAETAVRYAGVDVETIEKELTGSLKKILDYSQLPEEKCAEFQQYILAFMNMTDKASADDEARNLRRKLSKLFYEIYEAVFKRDHVEKTNTRLYDLFLNYGFVDERLLSKEQLIQLYCLEDQDDGQGICKVYNPKQWLNAIWAGEKEPSKSEFDMDYAETLRDMKKSGQITEEQMKKDMENLDKKFEYELHNMFKYNSRVVSGQLSIFVPILYKEEFMGHLDQSLMTTNKVNKLIEKIRSIDFSVFCRESLYHATNSEIKNENIVEEYVPDFIILPTYGSNGAMWQEIEGRKRASHARFVIPIFAEGDMEDVFIRMCGRFRWEICRTIQGPAWNDVKVKSLTSEYVDYIQFYKKNHALSEERKEKLKAQIQKGRGNTREVFVIDYLLWVKNESSGSIRMNKVARELLAYYCPFNKEIRERIGSQPMYEEAMARFNRERGKKVKELELRYRTYETKGIQVPEVMLKTMEFYRDK
ncbi:MAG: cyclic nucleotide-binding domain-containing protein [Lachnospiraceae bacterium]|nr:cyclic nucleotide-binding domain-containing protein [Lachnospiraceae bacterium]